MEQESYSLFAPNSQILTNVRTAGCVIQMPCVKIPLARIGVFVTKASLEMEKTVKVCIIHRLFRRKCTRTGGTGTEELSWQDIQLCCHNFTNWITESL